MNKHKAIIDLFRDAFNAQDIMERADLPYCNCPNIKKCDVNSKDEPIYTPMPGDTDSNIMVVAEAPSSSDGAGPKAGGYFGSVKEHKSPPSIEPG